MGKKKSVNNCPHIVGVGVDCEVISRFDELVNNRNVVSKILSSDELKIFQKKACKKGHFLAGRFVAKESIIKALSGVVPKLDMRDISIVSAGMSHPRVLVRHLFFKRNMTVFLSISHCDLLAIGLCIVQEKCA